MAFVAYINSRNPAYDVPLLGLLLCGGIGGVLGVVLAGLGEADVLLHLGSEPTLAVGVIEEAAKLLVPLAVLLFTRYRSVPADGLLVGVAAGDGFAVLETMGYGFTVLLETRDLAAVTSTLLIRGLASPAGHAAWTGLAAAALWRVWPTAALGRVWAHCGRPGALLGFVGTFLLVVVLHTASSCEMPAGTGPYVPTRRSGFRPELAQALGCLGRPPQVGLLYGTQRAAWGRLAYLNRPMARAMTNTTVISDTADWPSMVILAQRASGITSVGLNAQALVNEMYR